MAGGREAADRVGRDAAERGSVGAVPAGRDQSDAVLRLEKATAVLGDAGFRCCRRQAQCLGGEEGGGAAADERRGGGDHRGEPGAKKRALGLEDYGQLPPELQKRVHEEVKQARQRSGWPAKKTLAALGIPRRSYYRWLREGVHEEFKRARHRSVGPGKKTLAALAIRRGSYYRCLREKVWARFFPTE